jgi:hypothetical protein
MDAAEPVHQLVPTVNVCTLNLNLKAFIEGYYLPGGSMQAVLFNAGIVSDPLLCD